jgi:DHA1 family tetracycline resistance protein-like MFS transporter
MLKFGWSPAEIGYSLIAVGVLTAIVFGYLTRVVIPRIGEWNAAYAGVLLGAIGFTGYAFAWEGWVVYAFMIPWALMGISMPALTAIMSNEVGADQQGELQGALASLGGITSAIAPPLLAHLFGYFTAENAPVYFPGAAFFAAGLCMLAAFFLLLFSPLRQHSRSS